MRHIRRRGERPLASDLQADTVFAIPYPTEDSPFRFKGRPSPIERYRAPRSTDNLLG
jgi:hypothetical protein